MEKWTIPSGLTAAHDHSGLLGQSLASWPMVVGFGWPTPPVHGHNVLGALSPRGARPAHATWHGAQHRGGGLLAMRSSPRPSTDIPL
jgi:hypothetical protein